MNEQLIRISEKIEQLKKLDKSFSLFGSKEHRYKLNPAVPIEKIRQFELKYNVNLPTDYVDFMTQIGNGGVGPYYGLEPFENCLFDDLDYKRADTLLNPGKPFLHHEPWKLEFKTTFNEQQNKKEYQKAYSNFERIYFDKAQMNGVISICNYGCGVSLNLVVNGKEYGKIWTDGRGNDNGIYPSYELGNKEKITFLNWYELWLDISLRDIKEKQTVPNHSANNK